MLRPINYILAGFLLLLSVSCLGRNNVIVLVDRQLLEFDSSAIAYIDNAAELRRELLGDMYSRLNSTLRGYGADNDYYIYLGWENESGFFFSAGGYAAGAHSLADVRDLYDSPDAKTNNHIFDLLHTNNAQIDRQFPGVIYDTTLLLIFSKKSFAGLFNGIPQNTSLMFSEKDEFRYNSRDLHNYAYAVIGKGVLGEDSIVTRSEVIPLNEVCYQLAPKASNIFNSYNIGNTPSLFLAMNRRTMPNSTGVELYPVDGSGDIRTTLVGQTQAGIEWCRLLFVEGGDSRRNLNIATPLFNASKGNWPAMLEQPLSAVNASFPLYSLLKNTLVLDSIMPADTLYTGRVAVKYRMLDPHYNHAAFIDTIYFRLRVEPPMMLEEGLFKKTLIDNGVLVRYGFKLGPGRSWTQTEIISRYGKNVKIVLAAILLLAFFSIILIRTFLIRKRKFTLKNLITFYRK
ncbi:hypothetical protein [Taibaiella koreensis]|uniref:hypothetical protein n=1 Tax=Taibaiella koreensis TaxID=1268548 RepID=UPI000E59FC4B|nr:hypothetical protein [Taibaiella koreensis]